MTRLWPHGETTAELGLTIRNAYFMFRSFHVTRQPSPDPLTNAPPAAKWTSFLRCKPSVVIIIRYSLPGMTMCWAVHGWCPCSSPSNCEGGCVTLGFTVDKLEEQRGLKIHSGHTAGSERRWYPTPGSSDWQSPGTVPGTARHDLTSSARFEPSCLLHSLSPRKRLSVTHGY